MEATTLVGQFFSCFAQAEREVVWAYGGYPLIPRIYLFEFEINAIFLVYSPLWYEKRRDAFCGNFGVTKSTIEVDGMEVTIYTCPIDWSLDINLLAQEGEISLGMSRCQYATFTPM